MPISNFVLHGSAMREFSVSDMFLGAPVQIAGFTDVAEDASVVPQSVFTWTGRRFGASPC